MAGPHPFQALYRRHYGFVWQAVRRFGVGPPLTDDAVQETFITAYRRFDEISMPSAKSWLYGVARRVASNYRRADHRAARKRSAIAITVAAPSAQRPDLLIGLDRFLDALSPEDRELFVLSEIEGMSGPEAAAALTLNVSTCYSRVQSLRKRFRASFGEGDPGEVRRAARAERPRATTQGWALLCTQIGISTATKAAPILGAFTLAKAAAIALPIAAIVGIVGVAVSVSEPTPPQKVATAIVESEPRETDVPASAPAAVMPERSEPAPAPSKPVVEPQPVRARVRTAAPPAPAPEVPREPVASLALQNQLLVDAADQLRNGDVAEALAIVDRHAREFPQSPLADARTALRIEALCADHKPAQARGEARLFLRAHPRSLVRARIERSCAGTSVDSDPDGQ